MELISLITPTFNRREFFPRSIRCFLSQDYPNLEWVILDDGTDPVRDLLPDDPRIKYASVPPKQPHGPKMNWCFAHMNGDIGVVWDDDDWYAPNRVSKQVAPLLANSSLSVSGLGQYYYYRHGTKDCWLFTAPQAWMGAVALRKSAWEKHPFDEKPSSDSRVLASIPKAEWAKLAEPRLLVSTIHGGNDAAKNIYRAYVKQPWETVGSLIGEA